MRFTRLKIGQSETKELTVKNGINEPSIIGTVEKPFSFVSLKEIKGEFPASETIYFRENYTLQDENGDFATENQGFGVAGSTDASKKFTPDFAFPVVNITGPTAGTKYKIGQSVTITWESSNIDAFDLVVESGSGLLEVEDIDANLGTYTFNLTAAVGSFQVNDDISISLTDCMGPAADTANIRSIASVVVDAMTKTKLNTNFTGSGTSDGAFVKIEGQKPDNSWKTLIASLAVNSKIFTKSDLQLLSSDGFAANDIVAIRASDTTDNDGNNSSNIYTLATITMNNITGVVATVAKTISGTTNGASGKAYYRTSAVGQVPAGNWIEAGNITVDPGTKTWAYSITIATAGTYDIKVSDGTDADAFALQENIVVASASYKVQITSENCNFFSTDSIPIAGTDKIAVAGHISGMSGTVKIGGITIPWGSATSLSLCLLYDISTKTVDWVTPTNLTSSGATAGKIINSKMLHEDGNYLYWLPNTTNSTRIYKLALSDGSVNTFQTIGIATSSTGTPRARDTMVALGSYLYIMGFSDSGTPDKHYGFKVAMSDLSGYNTAVTLTPFSTSAEAQESYVSVATDGTYLYWTGVVLRGGVYKTETVRSDANIGSLSTVDTYYGYTGTPPANGTWIVGTVNKSGTKYASLFDYNAGFTIEKNWITDGTNKVELNVSASPFNRKLTISNSVIYQCAGVILSKIADNCSITFSKDYTANGISAVIGVNYIGTDTYIVCQVTGDADGEHAGNTKRCVFFGKIDTTNGNM